MTTLLKIACIATLALYITYQILCLIVYSGAQSVFLNRIAYISGIATVVAIGVTLIVFLISVFFND